jgi:hypothetical protein
MVRRNLDLRTAAAEHGILLTPEEAQRHARLASFQHILWRERYDYYAELGTTSYRGKEALVGQMQWLINQLVEAGQLDKALDGVAKIARVLSGEDDTSLEQIAALTAQQLDELKRKLHDKGT